MLGSFGRYVLCMRFALKFSVSCAAFALASPVMAQDESAVPYWASIRVGVVHMRAGPGTSYPIRWVYKRKQLPVKVIRREEGWRLVEDPDGSQGWMLGRFLSRDRTAIVTGSGLAEMRDRSGENARVMWRLEPGVTGTLGNCEAGWCDFAVGPHKGAAPQDRLWGPGNP